VSGKLTGGAELEASWAKQSTALTNK
jgi:hypothetical protein